MYSTAAIAKINIAIFVVFMAAVGWIIHNAFCASADLR
jgi:hypothetical protein